jgi:hypothetical protein
MTAFIGVIFLSAFLLFQVQPIIARYILPWYGGSPAVWTTCLLFFQIGLLGGYAYAHGLVSFLRERRKIQVGVHFALLALALFLLPITPSPDMKPDASGGDPVSGIVKLLSLTVGFPYLLLSATGPLLQHWFSEAFPGRSPFRLYAVSNLGSLLGLLTYPFLFEPKLRVTEQTTLWSAAFAGYALLAAAAAFFFLRMAKSAALPTGHGVKPSAKAGWFRVMQWIAFSACGSMLLLSLTNQMCQDVAVVPFLWVLPLSLYLLTFVIAFDHPRWYFRPLAIPLAVLVIGVTITVMNRQITLGDLPISYQIAIYCLAMFSGCLICHGEVARLKPDPRRLTGFFLSISFGGAVGGILVSLVAPLIFSGYWELHLAFALLALLVSQRLFSQLAPFLRKWRHESGFRSFLGIGSAAVACAAWIALLIAMAVGLRNHINRTMSNSIASSRGFYGVLQVTEENVGKTTGSRSLVHGRISHGMQFLDPKYRFAATAYYGVDSGVGTALKLLPERVLEPPSPIHVGIVGLGVGTLATYAKPGDRFRFYEINPQVVSLARSHFTYLEDCEGDEKVILGDGRISLERELAAGESQNFNLLVIDAFSGDSIPIHLLTREAFELYFKHLKPDGVLAVHITNRHLDLSDPIRNIAEATGWQAFQISHYPGDDRIDSDWILLTRDPILSSALTQSGRVTGWKRTQPKPIFWTDDYSNLFQVSH